MTMLTVKLNRKPFDNFNHLVEGFLHEFPASFKQDINEWESRYSVPVNVKETEKGYQLELVAPGFEKTDFSISLDQHLLTISGEKKNEVKAGNEKQIRREYSYRSFKRTFTLDEKIDATGIDAAYVNGVLKVELPKKAELKPSTKAIEVK